MGWKLRTRFIQLLLSPDLGGKAGETEAGFGQNKTDEGVL